MKDSTSGLTEASEGGWAIRGATLYIHEESDEFQSDTYDGLLRLAFSAILNLNHNLFFFTRRPPEDGRFVLKLDSTSPARSSSLAAQIRTSTRVA